MKNDNIHIFFFAVLVAKFEFAGFTPKQKYTAWTVSMWSVPYVQNPDRERTNQPGFAMDER